MTALAKDRNTPARSGDLYEFPVAADAVIHMGALICLSATGYAQPGAEALGLTAVGRAEGRVDATGLQDGDKTVTVRPGVFRFANSAAGEAVTLAEVGSQCFVADDQTVSKTDNSGARSVAGIVRDVDVQGVWVEIHPAAMGYVPVGGTTGQQLTKGSNADHDVAWATA